jgi:hypothetical protein
VSNQGSGETYSSKILETIFFAIIFILATKLFSPKTIPFGLFEFWTVKAPLLQAVRNSWPVFLWGAGFTTVMAILTTNDREHNIKAESHLVRGAVTSAMAGVFEEIIFRWIIFYGAIVTAKMLNFFFFDWCWIGIPQGLYTNIVGPIADWATLYKLHDILFNGFGWAVGAAVISSNGHFRDGHAYLGPIGFVNSWFMGMFFFYLMFHYGLPAAIIVHFLYDLIIYVVRYVDMVVERKLDLGH